ncbi:MAG: hypothetical protein RIM84_26225 [Alphaproteobacteria bacterium]
MGAQYDRSEENLGNIVALEHINVLVPDQRPATLFYMAGLGLTRDPYLMASVTNMWANCGKSQFHTPHGAPQVLRGTVGIVLPSRDELLDRLKKVKPHLKGTAFSYKAKNDHVDTTCPWGNRIRVHEPDRKRFGRMQLGMPYIEFDVPNGTARGIARFYNEIMATPAKVKGDAAHVSAGPNQEMIFREKKGKQAKYDGHHVAIYIADFSGPYDRLAERGLISRETDQYEYRFQDIIDLDTGKVLFVIEHEVRSMTHPLAFRPLVNRNPNQSNTNFAAGHETTSWSLPTGA